MAKFRKARKAYRSMRKASRRSSKGGSFGVMDAAIGGGVYGFARPYAANLIPDIPQLGGYSDNVILGGVAALAAWKGRGLLKKAGLSVLNNEAFVASSKAASGVTGGSTEGAVTSNWE